MKDDQLRRQVDIQDKETSNQRRELRHRLDALEELRLAVKSYPTCSHDTLHQFHPRSSPFRLGTDDTYSIGRSVAVEGNSFQQEDFHRCLTCGKDWVYGTQETAKPRKLPKVV